MEIDMDVIIVLASDSDKPYLMQPTSKPDKPPLDLLGILRKCGVSYELSYISTHRNPETLAAYCKSVNAKVGIGAASGSGGLPGSMAGLLEAQIVVFGVPLPRPEFPDAQDATHSMMHMPPGTPVNVSGIGYWGMHNAIISAVQVVAAGNVEVREKLAAYRRANNKTPQLGVERG